MQGKEQLDRKIPQSGALKSQIMNDESLLSGKTYRSHPLAALGDR
jgi:hypothetical protein